MDRPFIRTMDADRAARVETRSKPEIRAKVLLPSGKTFDLGRIDRKWWAPRAWWYRFVLFPRRVRAQRKEN